MYEDGTAQRLRMTCREKKMVRSLSLATQVNWWRQGTASRMAAVVDELEFQNVHRN